MSFRFLADSQWVNTPFVTIHIDCIWVLLLKLVNLFQRNGELYSLPIKVLIVLSHLLSLCGSLFLGSTAEVTAYLKQA